MPIKYTDDADLNRLFLDFDKLNRSIFKVGASIQSIAESSERYLGEPSVQFQLKRLSENIAFLNSSLK